MKKVLIVEDEVAYQKILKDKLEKEKFKVVVAGNGVEGIVDVAKIKPDIILIDIMLPGGMNGFDMLERLKANENTKQIPVIIVTNIATEAKVAGQIGAEAYFIKAETTIEEIVIKVKELLHIDSAKMKRNENSL